MKDNNPELNNRDITATCNYELASENSHGIYEALQGS